jgi:hypothetical protein
MQAGLCTQPAGTYLDVCWLMPAAGLMRTWLLFCACMRQTDRLLCLLWWCCMGVAQAGSCCIIREAMLMDGCCCGKQSVGVGRQKSSGAVPAILAVSLLRWLRRV